MNEETAGHALEEAPSQEQETGPPPALPVDARVAPARSEGRAAPAIGAALALVSFLATASIIDRVVTPIMPVVTRKLDRFAANKDAYSVAFVGTSLVYHGLAPAAFTDEMRRLGHEERAFNFSASHLCLGEALRIEDHIVSLHPKNLKRIVFDLELYDSLHDDNRDSTRDVWWHTPSATYDSLVRDFAEDVKPGVRFDDVTGDLSTFARHLVALGRLSDVFRSKWDPSITTSWDDLEQEDDDGYHSYDALPDPAQKRRHQRFLGQQADFVRRVQARKAQRAPARRISAYERSLLDTLVRRAREAGYEPVLLQMPDLDGTARLDAKEPGADPQARTWAVPRLSFNDPAAYPDASSRSPRPVRRHAHARRARRGCSSRSPSPAHTRRSPTASRSSTGAPPPNPRSSMGAPPPNPRSSTGSSTPSRRRFPAPDKAPSRTEPQR